MPFESLRVKEAVAKQSFATAFSSILLNKAFIQVFAEVIGIAKLTIYMRTIGYGKMLSLEAKVIHSKVIDLSSTNGGK